MGGGNVGMVIVSAWVALMGIPEPTDFDRRCGLG
jgi:hypothetical protein